jgi:hypothetical protein
MSNQEIINDDYPGLYKSADGASNNAQKKYFLYDTFKS